MSPDRPLLEAGTPNRESSGGLMVSVVIPVRNEERHVRDCLLSILRGSFTLDNLEILVMDGMSTDGTRAIVMEIAREYPVVQVLDNPRRHVPHAMNLGIQAARGRFLVRIDAHATYPPDYIERLLAAMEALGADNVGGVFRSRPGGSTAQARAVVIVQSHRFGVGNAMYRLRQDRAPYEVDTVPYGCYRREIFGRIGMFDEQFVRNQDDELNARLRRAGGRIFLLPDVHIAYVARDTLRRMGRMFFEYGYYKPLIALKLGRPTTLRQLVPPTFVASLLLLALASPIWSPARLAMAGLIAAYGAVCGGVAAFAARRDGARVVAATIAGFAVAHLSYGFGYLKGLVDFGIRRKSKRTAPHLTGDLIQLSPENRR